MSGWGRGRPVGGSSKLQAQEFTSYFARAFSSGLAVFCGQLIFWGSHSLTAQLSQIKQVKDIRKKLDGQNRYVPLVSTTEL